MIDQLMDSYRKASASWLQLQQDSFKQLANQQREALDAAYASGIQIIDQSFRVLQTWAEKSTAGAHNSQA